MPVSSPMLKPSDWFFEICPAPMFEVMTMIVLRKSTRRPLRVLDAGAGAADRPRDGLDRLVLADHALVQLVLHADEPRRLGLGELEDRDPRPHRDDVGDLLLAHLGLLGLGLVLAPVLLELPLLLRELALLVAQRGGLLELLVLDRVFLVLADLLDLFL